MGVNNKNSGKFKYLSTRIKRLLFLKKKQKIKINSKSYHKIFRRSIIGFSNNKKKNRNRRALFSKKGKILHAMTFLN